MRAFIYQTLANSGAIMKSLNQGGVVNDIYVANSLGTDPVPANPPTPFLIIQEQTPSVPFQQVRKTSHSAIQNWQIRCYTVRGDYGLIDQTLQVIRDTLLGIEYQTGPDGIRCTDIRWMGNTPDGEDQPLDLIFKGCNMRTVSNMKVGAQ